MKRSRQILQLCATIILISALLSCGKFSAKTTCNVDPVCYKSAVELTSAIQHGEITSSKLLNLYLERIKLYNGKINAVVAMDVDAARARATQADKALAQGQIWGPLHGLPMTVKDVYEVVGMPATSGDPRLKNHMPERNAIAVQRLIDAGAIVFGKTNTPFYAMDFQTFNEVYGTTNNPWDLTRTPGGSSGGAAAALAMGFTPLELGSDLGGSLRVPAHYTGVYGIAVRLSDLSSKQGKLCYSTPHRSGHSPVWHPAPHHMDSLCDYTPSCICLFRKRYKWWWFRIRWPTPSPDASFDNLAIL